MAKRSKMAARAGKVKGPAKGPEWKVIESKDSVEESPDSDDGSFLDDADMDDFLPSAWTGVSKEKKEGKPALITKKQAIISTAATTKSTTAKSYSKSSASTATTASLQGVTLGSSVTGSAMVTSSLDAALSREVIPSGKVINSSQTTNVESTAISGLVSPPTLQQSQVSVVEELRSQISSLERQLEMTKYESNKMRAELEAKVKRQDEDMQKFKLQSSNKNALHAKELLSLKSEYNEIKAERMEAVDGHRKLLNNNTALKAANEDLKKKWASARFKFEQVEKELETLKKDKLAQDLDLKELRRQDREIGDERIRLEAIVAAAELAKNTSRSDYDKLFSEVQRLRSQVQHSTTAQRNNQNWKHKCENLQRQYRQLDEDYQNTKREIISYKLEVTNLKRSRQSADRKLDNTENELAGVKSRVSRQVATIKDLTSNISKLERDRDLKAPVLQIGVDVRLRNFEHARETYLEVPRDEIDRSIIMNGNVAAHSANGAVDAAMFQAGLVPDEYMEDAEAIFKKMYQVEPSKYGCWSPKVLRLVDCQATINTVKAVRGRNASAELREEHSEMKRN
jgi:chromosome segregation ATPase